MFRFLFALPMLCLAACGGGGGSGSTPKIDGSGAGTNDNGSNSLAFTMATHRVVPFGLKVTHQGQPVQDAIVQVTDATRRAQSAVQGNAEDQIDHRLYYTGRTDAFGRIDVDVRVLTRISQCDVIVQRPGLTGPYSDEELRAESGMFAPSSRIRVGVADLQQLSIQFSSK